MISLKLLLPSINSLKGIDFINLKPSEFEGHEYEIIAADLPAAKGRGGHNKKFYFLTKFAMYSFILDCTTRTAKKVKMHVIDIYNKYHELLVFCRQQLIQKNFDMSNPMLLNFIVNVRMKFMMNIKNVNEERSRQLNQI
ncbi:hypothetical protein [Acanthamoeba polyphaga mimivirus]|uniref:Uncharacterized protein n=1 Tax=Acanthamoeba polyphaga mimivirus TaxID=212035 RepID=A0A0G2Y468_MIMIV|nr:hypothetical protein [Acanthamoeba polyphaga mimivirus]